MTMVEVCFQIRATEESWLALNMLPTVPNISERHVAKANNGRKIHTAKKGTVLGTSSSVLLSRYLGC